MTADISLTVNAVAKTYQVYQRPVDRLKQILFRGKRNYCQPFEALRPVSFQARKGEVIGIVGRNGSGKSTLLQLIAGTLIPTQGNVEFSGRVSALLELGSGFNQEFTGKENVYLNAAILGMSRPEIDKKYEDILVFANIGDYINRSVKTYSSGMVMRLAFAVAVACDPDILIVDEALAVGDAVFQRKCFARIMQLKERGTTILFVSHSANLVMEVCDRALLLDRGDVLYQGKPKQVISFYHKLIFAPDDKAEAIRVELSALRDNADMPVIPPDYIGSAAAEIPDAHYDPHLIPQSTVRLENHGVMLSDAYITDKHESKVNLLDRRAEYAFHFTVTTTRSIEKARFNFRIRSATGVRLAGANTMVQDAELEELEAGSRYRVTFHFSCLLLSGSYFTQIGCSGVEDDERNMLARVTDATMFRVREEEELPIGGMVDLMLKAEVEQLEPC